MLKYITLHSCQLCTLTTKSTFSFPLTKTCAQKKSYIVKLPRKVQSWSSICSAFSRRGSAGGELGTILPLPNQQQQKQKKEGKRKNEKIREEQIKRKRVLGNRKSWKKSGEKTAKKEETRSNSRQRSFHVQSSLNTGYCDWRRESTPILST